MRIWRPLSLCILAVWAGSSGGCRKDAEIGAPDLPARETEVIEEHWPDGTLRLRKHVLRESDGAVVDHGLYSRWYDTGGKEYEVTFVMGKKHGLATFRHRNGRKWIEEHYVDGLPHGVRSIWDQTGMKSKEEQYFKGKPHGTWTVWHKDGRIKWRQTYEHGVPGP